MQNYHSVNHEHVVTCVEARRRRAARQARCSELCRTLATGEQGSLNKGTK
jgi:hypothetical protein